MTSNQTYQALTPETLASRLGSIKAVTDQVGDNAAQWQVQEVGDGNLNLVFIVTGETGTVIVKQALPYVRLVGDSWPLPLYRAFYEHEALVRQQARDPGRVPALLYFDKEQALIVMEYLNPHIILRRKLINGERVTGLAQTIGEFCARTAFRGSELSMNSEKKKGDVALFAGNVAIPAITESLVFTDPYFNAEMNHHTPGLENIVGKIRANIELKRRVQRMLFRFCSNTETMLHGDLHSGSIMSTDTESKVIDPEFVQYGPMGFDIGMLLANYLMAYFSQPAHRNENDLQSYQQWILEVIEQTAQAFDAEFKQLWQSERTGMLYPTSLFEDQGHSSADACESVLSHIWRDAYGICGIEMHRRTLSLAHNADFEDIADTAIRAPLEARNLAMGAELILCAEKIDSISALNNMAKKFNMEECL